MWSKDPAVVFHGMRESVALYNLNIDSIHTIWESICKSTTKLIAHLTVWSLNLLQNQLVYTLFMNKDTFDFECVRLI